MTPKTKSTVDNPHQPSGNLRPPSLNRSSPILVYLEASSIIGCLGYYPRTKPLPPASRQHAPRLAGRMRTAPSHDAEALCYGCGEFV